MKTRNGGQTLTHHTYQTWVRKEKVDDNDADSDDNSKRPQKGRGGGGMVITGYRGKKCELLMQFL